MGLFGSTSEEREEEQKRQSQQLAAKVVAQAKEARIAGARIFQIDLAVSQTSGWSNFSLGTVSFSSPVRSAANLIELIEDQGWKLENVGYVYRTTDTVSTGKALGSGQREVIRGDIVGIYIFRAVESQKAGEAA